MALQEIDRRDLMQTGAVVLATFAALALLGWVLAYWTWAAFAPDVEPAAPLAATPQIRPDVAASLFGDAAREASAGGGDVALLGVMATSGRRPGYAIMRYRGQAATTVREGDELAPGVRLAKVFADSVTLERGTARETVARPDNKAADALVSPTDN